MRLLAITSEDAPPAFDVVRSMEGGMIAVKRGPQTRRATLQVAATDTELLGLMRYLEQNSLEVYLVTSPPGQALACREHDECRDSIEMGVACWERSHPRAK